MAMLLVRDMINEVGRLLTQPLKCSYNGAEKRRRLGWYYNSLAKAKLYLRGKKTPDLQSFGRPCDHYPEEMPSQIEIHWCRLAIK